MKNKNNNFFNIFIIILILLLIILFNNLENKEKFNEIDVNGSCKNNCGNNINNCWCDHQCEIYNDCCEDKELYCGKAPNSCMDNKGNKYCGLSGGNCYCDDICHEHDDCCEDKINVCGLTQGENLEYNKFNKLENKLNKLNDNTKINILKKLNLFNKEINYDTKLLNSEIKKYIIESEDINLFEQLLNLSNKEKNDINEKNLVSKKISAVNDKKIIKKNIRNINVLVQNKNDLSNNIKEPFQNLISNSAMLYDLSK